MTEFAPAKVNLALHVTGRRSDGYHLLESFVVFTRFGDRITVEPSAQDRFSVTGRYAADVPADGSNLVVQARDALRRFVERSAKERAISKPAAFPVAVHLEKNLPVASGVGGGSSDAAAVLRALNRLWDLRMGLNDLAGIGLSLGADVPMCLMARPLLARGIGDELSGVGDFPAHGLVLVNPGRALSTPQVFAALTRRDNEGLPTLPKTLDFHGLRNWLETTRNDLEPPARAIEPAIGYVLGELNRAGAGFARMSGSGATCFGLFETGNVAKRAAAQLRARHPDWFVAATRSMASGTDEHG
jgi:4-diphosphocytidyl-2-C-methyl-D-erythritol kinase